MLYCRQLINELLEMYYIVITCILFHSSTIPFHGVSDFTVSLILINNPKSEINFVNPKLYTRKMSKQFSVEYSEVEQESSLIQHETKKKSARVYLLATSLIGTLAVSVIVLSTLTTGSETSESPCVTAYGSILGQDNKGVIGYSNCNDEYVSDEPHFVNVSGSVIYSGMRYQCVGNSSNCNFNYI